MFERLKKIWNDYLERLAKTNQELYKNGKPDCCAKGNIKSSIKKRHCCEG